MRFFNLNIDSQKVNRNPVFWWLLTAMLFCTIYIVYLVSDISLEQKEVNIKNRIERILSEKENILTNVAKEIILNSDTKSISLANHQDKLKDQNIEIFVFQNDSLKSWSSNLVAIENYQYDFDSSRVLKLNNGWYRVYFYEKENISVYGAILLKQSYNYQNDYLKKSFPEDFKIDESYQLSTFPSLINIVDEDGEFLFSLASKKEGQLTDSQVYKLFLTYHLLLVLIIVFIIKFYERYSDQFRYSKYIYLIAALDVMLLWLIVKWWKVPAILFDSFLYSPEFFSDYFNGSIGSFFTNAIFLLIVFYLVFFKHQIQIKIKHPSKAMTYVVLGALSMGLVIVLKAYESAVQSLLENSKISIQFGQDLMNNFWPTLIAFSIISTLSLALFFIFQRAAILSNSLLKRKNEKLLLIASFIIIYLICSFTIFDFRPYSLFFVFLIITSYWGIRNNKLRFNSLLVVLYLIIFSAYLSVLSTYVLRNKEFNERIATIEKISNARDQKLEQSFKNIEHSIFSNESLLEVLSNIQSEEDEMKVVDIIGAYFENQGWEQYSAYVTLCDPYYTDPENENLSCDDEVLNYIQSVGIPTVHRNLFYIENNSINNSYLARLAFDFDEDGSTDQLIFVDLISEFIPEGLGYPVLFTNRDSRILVEDLSDYSFAKYQDGKLSYKFGNYFYSIELENYQTHIEKGNQFNFNNYDHLFYKSEDGSSYIISRENKEFWELVAPFSYYFILISLFVLCFSIITQFNPKVFTKKFSFIYRIQFNFLALIFASFVIIAVVTLFYLKQLNDDKNQEILSEKALSVLIELEHKLAAEHSITADMEPYLEELLTKFSLVFFSDINLFDMEGMLLASSRPQVYQEGLLSRTMNTDAFELLKYNKKLLFIQDERIGNYNYLSAYIPFRNGEGNIIAYLNLPYFARQIELQKEITTFLVALVNIYVLFFVVAIVIAVIISRRISKPIQLIRERIRGLELGKSNEIIAWDREDEIGDLIAEYNRMIGELGKSAQLLAKSEREGAWREMAKQVAHEIKNPLTPMKLSVQYLERAWNEKSDDWEERLKRFTVTIIDQIDTLSKIATEFSDFAKMPQRKIERVDLVTVIRNSLSLFKDVHNIDFNFETISHSCIVNADRSQILRVFNNLIKNSIQAIGKQKQGEIHIDIYERNGFFKIRVSDNGSGISEDMADKIFSPSFTTKSSGMGLGLSIVKSIILEAGGTIEFDSTENKGTVFNIQLPVA